MDFQSSERWRNGIFSRTFIFDIPRLCLLFQLFNVYISKNLLVFADQFSMNFRPILIGISLNFQKETDTLFDGKNGYAEPLGTSEDTENRVPCFWKLT